MANKLNNQSGLSPFGAMGNKEKYEKIQSRYGYRQKLLRGYCGFFG